MKVIHIHCRIFGKYTGKIKIISNFSTQRETLTAFYSVFFPEVIHLYIYLLSFKIIQNKQQIHFCIFFKLLFAVNIMSPTFSPFKSHFKIFLWLHDIPLYEIFHNVSSLLLWNIYIFLLFHCYKLICQDCWALSMDQVFWWVFYI